MPLSVKDGMSAWIDDFKKSDAPQFKGKSDKERREMAIAAYMSAKNEATDNPPFTPDPPKPDAKNSDGSKTTAMSRAKQLAKKARDAQKNEAVTYHGNPNKDDDARNAARRRRLAKQDNKVKLKGFGPDAAKGNMGNPAARAALKPTNEISQDLKKRYTDKAKSDYGHQQFSADIAREMGAKDAEKYHRRKQRNRMAGITKATRESVELEEATLSIMCDPATAKRMMSVCKDNNVNCKKQGKSCVLNGNQRDILRVMYKMKFPTNVYHGKIKESMELDEMKANAAYTKAAKDIKAYAAKNGGVDKKDMMNFAADLELMGRAPNILQAGRILDRINKRFGGYDTDVRDRLSMYLKKHGLMESVNEAKSFDQKFKDHLKFATSKSPAVQAYMKKRAADRDAMNKKNDPNAAKKGYALSAVPPERAFKKARKKGMSASDASQAVGTASRNRGKKLPK